MDKPYVPRSGMTFVISSLIAMFLLLAAGNASAQEVLSVTNGIYRLSLTEGPIGNGMGMFTLSTGDSHPFPGESILYGGAEANPRTSYLTIRSYSSNTDYVSAFLGSFSSPFNVVKLDSCSPVVSPTEGMMGFRTTWSCNEDDILTIEQVTEIEGTTVNDSFVRITTTVSNRFEAPVQIGIRYMWDWMIDGSDDAMIKRHHPDDPGFTRFFFEEVPPQFEYYEETNTHPTFSIFGTVNGPAGLNPSPTPPDRFNYSDWETAYLYTWDFPVTGGNSDSAACYFWGDTLANAITLEPGQSYSVTQYMTTFEQSIALAISGVVQSDGIGLPGVSMSGLPDAPTTDSNGFYRGTVPYGWSGTVTPIKEGYAFDPPSRSYANVTSNRADQNYFGQSVVLAISGVVQSDGIGLSGVSMSGLPDAPTTDSNGFYRGTVPYGWSGVVTPTREGYTFDPPSRSYANVTSNRADQNYFEQSVVLAISGVVQSGGIGLPGVSMSGLPDAPTTDSNGFYRGTVPYGWSGTVTPIREGYTFDPPSRSYANVTSNRVDENYIANSRSFAYITNFNEDKVSVVDLITNSVLSEINVEQKPLGVAANTQRMAVYVTNYDSNTVSVIDAGTNAVTATINVGSNPVGIAIDKAGSTLFVANYKGNSVSVIDTATNQVVATVKVGTEPCGIAVSPDGSTAYVTDYQSGTVSVIEEASSAFEVISRIRVGTGPYGIAMHPSGSTVYVANYAAGTVSVIDAATNTAVAKVKVGGRPTGMAVDPSGTLVYVTKNEGDTVSVIDTTTLEVVGTVKVGRAPFGIATNADGTRIYVANSRDNTISIVDTGDFGVEATVPVGGRPMAFGDFVISREGSGSIVLDQPLKLIPAQEEEDQFQKQKVRPPTHPPHVE